MKKVLILTVMASLLAASCGSGQGSDQPEKENEVIETIMARRSIRKYTSQKVELEKLQKVLECGINVPTGMYKQSWQLRVVENSELLYAIAIGYPDQESKAKPRDMGRVKFIE